MADSDRAEEQVPPAQVLKAFRRGGRLQKLGLGDEFLHRHITRQGAAGVLEGNRQGQQFPLGEGLPDGCPGSGGGLDLGQGQGRKRWRLGRLAFGHHSPLGIEDRQAGQLEFRRGLRKAARESPLFLSPALSFGQLQAHQFATSLELVFQFPGNSAAHGQGLIQGLLHLAVPGVIHPAGHQLPGHDEDKEGGQQGQGNEGQDQTGPQTGTEYLATPLQKELGQVAKNEKGEQEQEEGVDIQESEGQETAGHRLAALPHQVDFQGGNGHHQDQRYGDEDASRRRFCCSWGEVSWWGEPLRSISTFFRQSHREGTAASGGAVHRNGAVVIGDNLVDHRQPQAGALVLGGVKRMEDLFLDVLRHPLAGILDRNHTLGVPGPSAHQHGALVFRGLQGIFTQVLTEPS